jgi:hypothetical protein
LAKVSAARQNQQAAAFISWEDGVLNLVATMARMTTGKITSVVKTLPRAMNLKKITILSNEEPEPKEEEQYRESDDS